jgi:hypothetical protein
MNAAPTATLRPGAGASQQLLRSRPASRTAQVRKDCL